MDRSTEEKGYFHWPWLQHRLEPGVQEAGVAYLADATDTHVQGVSGAPSPIQDKVLSLCLTPEHAMGGRVVVLWKPFIITSLVLNIIEGWTLLGSEVVCIQRAVLRQRKRATGTLQGELGQLKVKQVSLSPMRADPYLLLSRSHLIPLPLTSKQNLQCGILLLPLWSWYFK